MTFECKADGVPTPILKWIHNGRPIEETADNPNMYIEPNRIRITNLRKSDTGNYGCNATNSIGYVYKDVYINVLDLPPRNHRPSRDRGQNCRREKDDSELQDFRGPQAHCQVVPRGG